LTDELVINQGGEIAVGSRGEGKSGDLEIKTSKLKLTNGGVIRSNAEGAGQGGDVVIVAADSIDISERDGDENRSGILIETFGDGDGGSVLVSTSTLEMDDGLIGTVTHEEAQGDAGDIAVNADRISLIDGGLIASGSFGSGQAGDVTVKATESIQIFGENLEEVRSGVSSETEGRGNAGRIFISAPVLSMVGGEISANTFGQGTGGNIVLKVEKLTTQPHSEFGQSLITASTGGSETADAGTISILATSLEMEDGQIRALSFEDGDAGNIEVQAERIELNGGALITSESFGSGQSGNVTVKATKSIHFAGQDATEISSGVSTNTEGRGKGGRGFISAPVLSMEGGRDQCQHFGHW
jgi:large exoprotein involved in heme utilization and adhesion